MKIPALLLLSTSLSGSFLFGQQSQSALPAGSVPPASAAPAPAPSQASDATVVEEIIVRINN
ncbi:MAG TPA: hypothetical protein VN620_06610, partial [Candidatus Methylomirabilis sp.]|nr:hypothetical protein [Candidatus Methylomirabilis sp.]